MAHLKNDLVSEGHNSPEAWIAALNIPLNPRQEIAIKHLQDPEHSRITNSDLQLLCPDVHAETIRRDLADLVTKNVLKKMGVKRGSYYIINPQWSQS